MAFLAKVRKEGLLILAEELGEKVRSELRILDLRQLIMRNKSYEEELVKDLLENITSMKLDRKEEERQDRIRREEREFELTRLRLLAVNGNDSLTGGNEENVLAITTCKKLFQNSILKRRILIHI
ncbi:hypothetical protein X975_23576, partial [Stegodyphus mimosarum]